MEGPWKEADRMMMNIAAGICFLIVAGVMVAMYLFSRK